MRLMLRRLIYLLVILFATSCGVSQGAIPINTAGEMINAIELLPERSKNSGCNYSSSYCERDIFEFDINEYFSVFEHLSVEPGFKIDYIYMRDSAGGKPVVYAYQESDAPLDGYEEFVQVSGSEFQGSFATIQHSDDYLAHIQIDDTPEGYFQYVALSIMEDQFYLNWHANYNDTTIITSAEQGFDVFSSTNFLWDRDEGEWIQEKSAFYLWTRWIESRIPRLNYTPVVIMQDEKATVRFIIYSQWGGFTEVTAVIERGFPHDFLELKEKGRIFYTSFISY